MKWNNFIPLELRSLNKEALLSYYDNPTNFNVGDCRNKKYNLKCPGNIVVMLTHATFWVPLSVRNAIQNTRNNIFRLIEKAKLLRLVRNFSDFWTRELIKFSWISKYKVLINKASRLIWDANRSGDDHDFIREKDFSWNIILSEPESFRSVWEELTWEYHSDAYTKLTMIEQKSWWIIAFDIHDTWVRLMGDNPDEDNFRKGGFPFITLWTRDWWSCNNEILKYFTQRLEYYLWIKPLLNHPYKWWYVTKLHWEEYRKQNKTKKRNVIQIEFGRFLYMRESTQELDFERVEIIWEWLKRAIYDTWNHFNKIYFDNL